LEEEKRGGRKETISASKGILDRKKRSWKSEKEEKLVYLSKERGKDKKETIRRQTRMKGPSRFTSQEATMS